MHQEKKSDQNIFYSLIHKKMEIIFDYPMYNIYPNSSRSRSP